jgi:hypothetical protein
MRVVAMSLVCLAGCGAEDPGQRFMGTWSFASGTDSVSCPNGTTEVKLTGTLTIKPATEGGLLVLDGEGCNFTYALAGDRATASGKTCSFPVPALGQGVVAAVTYDAITLATRDGATMTDTFSGKVAYTSSAGTLDCVFGGMATLDKVSAQ